MSAFPPTPRQAAALRFIWGFQLANGRTPTLSEIGAGIGVVGKSSPKRLVDGLAERGHLIIDRGTWPWNTRRSIEVIGEPAIPRAPDGEPLFVVPGFGERG